MRCQNPRSRYLVVCIYLFIYLFLPGLTHITNLAGKIHLLPNTPRQTGGNLESVGWIGPPFLRHCLIFLIYFWNNVSPWKIWAFVFSESKTYPQLKMRRWTLKLRAQIVFFIIGTCVICQCGLINGESKYSFLLFKKTKTFSKQCCCMFDITHILCCFQLLTALPNTPCI